MGAKNHESQRVKARQIYEFIQENLYFNQPDLTIKQGNRIKIITIKLPFKSLLFPSLMFKTSGKTR